MKTGRMVQMYKCERRTNQGTQEPWRYLSLCFRTLSFQIGKLYDPCISMLSVCPLASSVETVDWFSRYKDHLHLKVNPTPLFKFYFPPISNNHMKNTQICETASTVALLSLRPKNDGYGLGISCACYWNVLQNYSLSTTVHVHL